MRPSSAAHTAWTKRAGRFRSLGDGQIDFKRVFTLLTEAGFRVLTVEDATENMAEMAGRWREARANREQALRKIEGDDSFEGQQRFLEVASRLARERRLSRFIYLAEKPD